MTRALGIRLGIRRADNQLQVTDLTGHTTNWPDKTAGEYREAAAHHERLAVLFSGDLTAAGHRSFQWMMDQIADWLDDEEREQTGWSFEVCEDCADPVGGQITFRPGRVAVRHQHPGRAPSAHVTIHDDGRVEDHPVGSWSTGGPR